MSYTTVDNVHRDKRLDIKVIVVGAGVGGLLTALECWRKGGEVVVLERASAISPIGKDREFRTPSRSCTETILIRFIRRLLHYSTFGIDNTQQVSFNAFRLSQRCVQLLNQHLATQWKMRQDIHAGMGPGPS